MENNSWLGSLLGLGGGFAALDYLMDQTREDRGDVSSTIDQMISDTGENLGFNPYTVRSKGLGDTSLSPDGTLNMELNDPWKQMSNQFRWNAGNMLAGNNANNQYMQQMLNAQRMNLTDPTAYTGLAGMKKDAYGQYDHFSGLAGMDPAQRETDVYNRIRAMQAPEEERQMSAMNNSLFSGGRGGMMSDMYGGTAEQHAFGKAQAEARNQASLQAMGQAQKEMMNYGSLADQFGQFGSNLAGQQQKLASQNISDILGITGGMGQNSAQAAQAAAAMQGAAMDPYRFMLDQAGIGQRDRQMSNDYGLQRQRMLNELGLGGLSTELNYSNIMGNLFGQAMPGMMSALAGVGAGIEDQPWWPF